MIVCPLARGESSKHYYVYEGGFVRCVMCHTTITVASLTDNWLPYEQDEK